YGGSVPSGWTRLVLEEFEFEHKIVYPSTLDAGNLSNQFDVLIFVDDSLEVAAAPRTVPEEYRSRIGSITTSKTLPQLKQFLEAGGVVLAIGNSTELARLAGLPISSALVEPSADGGEQRLPRTRFYVPGSILEARVDLTNPIA